jgi:DNA-directed RNA polymerase III subunit RPC6
MAPPAKRKKPSDNGTAAESNATPVTEDILEEVEEGDEGPIQKRQKKATPATNQKTKEKHYLLYDRCVAEKPIGDHFSVQELTEFDIADDQDELKTLTQTLVDLHLFTPLHLNRGFLYRLRTKDVAYKLAKLSLETHMIYQHIEGSGSAGTWKRTLVLKTNLHENTATKSLKELVAKGLVREIKSAKYPTRRIYLLSHIKPSADNLGGNFFDGGVLDEALVYEMKKLAVYTIEQASWAKREIPTPQLPTEVDFTSKKSKFKARPKFEYFPHPPDYEGYPTTLDVLASITSSGILQAGVTLVEDDISKLLKSLEYDGQIELVRTSQGKLTNGYRSVHRGSKMGMKPQPGGHEQGFLGINEVDEEGRPGNGFTGVPCGRCEVFKACRVGGVVSPEGCVYMTEWLDF